MKKYITLLTLAASIAAGATAKRPTQPYTFEENHGQAHESVKFLARGEGYGLYLTEREAVLSLARDARTQQVIRMSLEGSRVPQSVAGLRPTGQTSNYLVGNQNQWKTDVPHYERVRYAGVYPGIDLIYHSASNHLEYDFAVEPGAAPDAIRLHFEGVPELHVNRGGSLDLRLGDRKLVHQAPVAYQDIDGKRRLVSAAYEVRGDHSVGFRVGRYDRTRPLVIDPVVLYTTYLGGDKADTINAIAVDPQGNTYVTGVTTSTNFPRVGAGVFQQTFAVFTAFVTKYNATGTAILHSTYLGGGSNTTGYAIQVDAQGNAYLGGVTGAKDFPMVNATQTTHPGLNIGYVAKLNSQGNALLFSTYLGGERNDEVRGLALDKDGNIAVAGRATSTSFPTSNAIQPAFGGSQDAFVTVYRSPDYRIKYSTYLGKTGSEDALAVTFANGMATPGAYQNTVKSPNDGFIARISNLGNNLDWFTYYGGSGDEKAQAVAIDSTGAVLVGGYTSSANLPTTPNAIQTARRGANDAFLARFSTTGAELLYGSYIGSSATGVDAATTESINGIVVDASGGVNIAGIANGADFPSVRPVQAYAGKVDAFVARLNADLTGFIFSTPLGGTAQDLAFGLAVDAQGGLHVAGETDSTDLPLKNPIDNTFAGGQEGFVSHICDPFLIASNLNVAFVYEKGKTVPAAQTVQISACAQIPFTVQAVGDHVRATAANGSTNSNITISVVPGNLDLGTYTGKVVVTAPDAVNSPLTINVVLKIVGPPPVISTAGVGSAATLLAGPIAPGELIVIYGQNIGPNNLATAELDTDGRVTATLKDTRVLFNGIPGRLIYTFNSVLSVIVPYALTGASNVNIEVEYMGVKSNMINVPMAATAPGIFTANASGTGQGALLNADYSPNSAGNPVERGGAILIYGTGDGQSDPGGIDGDLSVFPLRKPLVPVTVTVGGINAQVLYAGSAPGLVAGVFQINVTIPQGVTPGNAEILVKVGNVTSRAGVTVAVK
jgi:uncharacterized protein (TIGR03437 family)